MMRGKENGEMIVNEYKASFRKIEVSKIQTNFNYPSLKIVT
jgi:hypothetical protein